MRIPGSITPMVALTLFSVGSVDRLGAQTPGHMPDTKHGAIIAAQGTPQGAPPCAQCHAFSGESDGSGAFPRLARQSADYLAAQLHDFASGIRNSALMSQIAKSMTSDEMADVAAYYANTDAPFVPQKPADPALLKRGEQLARVGSAREQIPACNACHGPAGAGEPPAIPYLAGQYGQYIALNLQLWQNGFRKNSEGGMATVAGKLSPQDVAAVAAYYQQLAPSLETSLDGEKR